MRDVCFPLTAPQLFCCLKIDPWAVSKRYFQPLLAKLWENCNSYLHVAAGIRRVFDPGTVQLGAAARDLRLEGFGKRDMPASGVLQVSVGARLEGDFGFDLRYEALIRRRRRRHAGLGRKSDQNCSSISWSSRWIPLIAKVAMLHERYVCLKMAASPSSKQLGMRSEVSSCFMLHAFPTIDSHRCHLKGTTHVDVGTEVSVSVI